ncbi:copper homeostasis periplasmic binding protein CopC [Xenorhabdus szentirmaii]|uniref:Copper resistance protein C n=2 Tax=Xenorhabdus szentirmaii TaxID=290112 RepID=W1ITF6_9GAMM|nr:MULTISPECIES: copper homeostasis periplasmic binding protein CopC [Xenorhabdus]MBD2779765.1 copper homeostasis periplasmic binding protein CopC [Xenorhabdus sp. 38]MBD2793439.1 copper homeostasis periplasmic binding protein CopC [Xenorhabdus sp. CUL]MBD2802723.1 copper homeostasis periplasmic binding protein CopC [Xenorhabdus sp. M]MBD2819552.1 copper homeostasis periplasmic binding protein CopC [Xenorhabdus sp. 42]MBD2826230.1 copper homeostasis periplasmic binding protein CopC [Xenorhabdu
MSTLKVRSFWTKLSALMVLFVGISCQQALAHAHLKDQTPAENTTVEAAPQAITLSFSERIELGFSKVKLIGPEKVAIKTGKLELDPETKTKLILPVEGKLAAGEYSVDWSVLSVDGHKTKGVYNFTVK